MRWLITGAAGMLGQDLVSLLEGSGEAVTALARDRLDVTDPAAVSDAVSGHDVVVNCAAWTAVDAAEESEAEAFTVNAVGAATLARAAAGAGARIVQVSTDYVFDGRADSPYEADAPVRPQSAYGRTKAAGEWAVRAEHPAGALVVRTAWLYGAGGGCFPKTIARAATQKPLTVVTDQVGQPTWTADVARVVRDLVTRDAPAGTYHATSGGVASWFDFARAVCESSGAGADRVGETTSDAYVRPAPRPAYSVLGHRSLIDAGVEPIGDWRERWAEAAASVLADL